MPKVKKLSWNDKQTKIAQLLTEGTLLKKEIAAEVGVDAGYVTQVKNALAAGQSPPGLIPISKGSEDNDDSQAYTGEEVPGEEEEEKPPYVPPKGMQAQVTSLSSANAKAVKPGIASAFKFVNVPIVCPITPIMLNARALFEKEYGWPKDMTWEDFFDTLITLYCTSIDYTIQGYIKNKEVEEKEAATAPPVTAPEKPGGNGHIDTHKLAIEVAQILIQMANQ
jgi:hypothetical protein